MTDQTTTVRTVPWFGAMQAFKRRYERLHPSVQMIGLQLWLPVCFVILFVLCYVNAFHSPTPHDMPVGVVGTQAASQVDAGLEKALPGGFSVTRLASVDSDAIRTGRLVAVYDPSTAGGPTLVIGSAAAGSANVSAVENTFRPLAAASGAPLQVKDIAPLPASDSSGTVALYVSLVATIGGYMVGMFCGMMGGPLKRRTRFGILAGSAVVMSIVAATLTGPIVGALHGHFLELWAIMFATMLAVGLVVNGLGYFLGRFVTGAALLVFVFLNIPASGGAMPVDMVGEPFRWLNHVVVGGGIIPLIRSVFYDAGPGAHVGIWRLAVYAVAGLALAWVGPAYARWRYHRRALLGLPAGGMMAHAQRQLMLAAQQAAAQSGRPADEDASGTAVEAEALVEETLSAEESVTGNAGAAGGAAGGE